MASVSPISTSVDPEEANQQQSQEQHVTNGGCDWCEAADPIVTLSAADLAAARAHAAATMREASLTLRPKSAYGLARIEAARQAGEPVWDPGA